jgi:hypothetical protein
MTVNSYTRISALNTLANIAIAATSFVYMGISMASRTVRLLGILSLRTYSAQNIYLLSHDFDMSRIYTMTNPTQMVTNQTIGNVSDKEQIENFVSHQTLVFVQAKPAITGLVELRCSPFPTRDSVVRMFGRYLDFGKEAFKKFCVSRRLRIICIQHRFSPRKKVYVGLWARCELV